MVSLDLYRTFTYAGTLSLTRSSHTKPTEGCLLRKASFIPENSQDRDMEGFHNFITERLQFVYNLVITLI